jgi:hypothetical protein
MTFIPWFCTIKEYPIKYSRDPGDTYSKKKKGYIIHKILDMKKRSAKWVPKCLNADQKWEMLASHAIFGWFHQNPVGVLNHLISMDETWFHDPETKE